MADDPLMDLKIERFSQVIQDILNKKGLEDSLGDNVWGLHFPEKKFKNIRQVLNISDDEQVFVLFDYAESKTFFGSTKAGMVITSWGIRCKTSSEEWDLSWKTIVEQYECVESDHQENEKTVSRLFLEAKDKNNPHLKRLNRRGPDIDASLLRTIIEQGTAIFGLGSIDPTELDQALSTSEESEDTASNFVIVYDLDGENASMAFFLQYIFDDEEKHSSCLKSIDEYEVALFEEELLGTGTQKPVVFVGKPNSEGKPTELAALIEKLKGSWKYNEFGMKYGWIGNKAVLLVEKTDFDDAQKENLGKVLGQTLKSKNILQKGMEAVDKLPAGVKFVGNIFNKLTFGVVEDVGTILTSSLANDIFEAQQEYLLEKFYYEALAVFLAENGVTIAIEKPASKPAPIPQPQAAPQNPEGKPPKGLDIFKFTPKTNCKECGKPTCMAFCMAVSQGGIKITECPYIPISAIPPQWLPPEQAAPQKPASKPAPIPQPQAAPQQSVPEQQVVCSSCGEPVPAGAKFCMSCGGKVEQELLCSGCGTKLPPGAKFCSSCGTKTGAA